MARSPAFDASETSAGTIARGYLRLIHPVPVFFVMLGTALFGLLAAGGHPDAWRYLLMLLAMLGGQAAIGAHNEWRDRSVDALHQPDKPIPAGMVRPELVWTIIVGGLFIGVVAAGALGALEFALYLVGTGAGLTYNLWFKRTPLSGLPYLIGLPLLPIWTTLVMDAFEPRLLLLYPLGGAFVVAIHLAQALVDIEGDRASGTRGLAVILGRRRTLGVIWMIAFGTALLLPLGAFTLGDEPAFGFVGSAITIGLFVAFLSESRHRDRWLFATLCAGATILSSSWILALS